MAYYYLFSAVNLLLFFAVVRVQFVVNAILLIGMPTNLLHVAAANMLIGIWNAVNLLLHVLLIFCWFCCYEYCFCCFSFPATTDNYCCYCCCDSNLMQVLHIANLLCKCY